MLDVGCSVAHAHWAFLQDAPKSLGGWQWGGNHCQNEGGNLLLVHQTSFSPLQLHSLSVHRRGQAAGAFLAASLSTRSYTCLVLHRKKAFSSCPAKISEGANDAETAQTMPLTKGDSPHRTTLPMDGELGSAGSKYSPMETRPQPYSVRARQASEWSRRLLRLDGAIWRRRKPMVDNAPRGALDAPPAHAGRRHRWITLSNSSPSSLVDRKSQHLRTGRQFWDDQRSSAQHVGT